jgi:hypothetical protein
MSLCEKIAGKIRYGVACNEILKKCVFAVVLCSRVGPIQLVVFKNYWRILMQNMHIRVLLTIFIEFYMHLH